MTVKELYPKGENLSWTAFEERERFIKYVTNQMMELFNTCDKFDEDSVVLGRNVQFISALHKRTDGRYNARTVWYGLDDINKINEYLKLCHLDNEWEITVELVRNPFGRKLVLHRKGDENEKHEEQ